MAKLKVVKLRASTLLEVVVAMVVILIVFVFAMGIYANIVSSSPSVKAQKYRSVISGLIQESIRKKNWEEETVLIDSVWFKKTVGLFPDYPDVLMISVTGTAHGKVVGKGSQLVKVTEDENK